MYWLSHVKSQTTFCLTPKIGCTEALDYVMSPMPTTSQMIRFAAVGQVASRGGATELLAEGDATGVLAEAT